VKIDMTDGVTTMHRWDPWEPVIRKVSQGD